MGVTAWSVSVSLYVFEVFVASSFALGKGAADFRSIMGSSGVVRKEFRRVPIISLMWPVVGSLPTIGANVR